MSDAERAADLDQASLEVYVEAAVDDRVDCAVEQRQRLDRHVDGVGDRMAVLGQMLNRWTAKYGVQQPMNVPMMLRVICTKPRHAPCAMHIKLIFRDRRS